MKDFQDTQDTNQESDSISESLSESGRQRMMFGNDNDVDLEQKVERLRSEKEAQEAAAMAELNRPLEENAESEETQDVGNDADASPEFPSDYQPQIATTELGKARQVEAGAEMPERKLFSDIDETRGREGSIPRPGRLR